MGEPTQRRGVSTPRIPQRESATSARMLLVEDCEEDYDFAREVLAMGRAAHLHVTHVASLSEALLRLSAERYDVIMLDLTLPDSDGLETVSSVRSHATATPIVVLTGLNDEKLALAALSNGADDYLVKGAVDGAAMSRSLVYAIERGRARDHLRRRELQLAEAQAMAQLGSCEWDPARGTLEWSDELYRIHGLDCHGPRITRAREAALIHPEDRAHVDATLEAALDGRGPAERAYRIVRPDGQLRHLHAILTRVNNPDGRHVLCSVQDVTERKRLEEQLRQAQKMEALGTPGRRRRPRFQQHADRHPRQQLAPPERARPRRPAAAGAAGDRAGGRAGGGADPPASGVQPPAGHAAEGARPQPVIAEETKMLRRLIGEDVTLVDPPRAGPGHVRADRGHIEQVILNLAVNARDAMRQRGHADDRNGRTPTLGEATAARARRSPARYVLLAVTDTGTAWTRPPQRRFRAVLHDQGLARARGSGLATVYGIVQQSGGTIELSTELGIGSAFHVYFPSTVGALFAEPAGADAAATLDSLRGTETILIVEDDPNVRPLACRMVSDLGYRVLAAADGPEALRTAAAHPDRIHLLLTDVVMPTMSGKMLCERLRQDRPEIAVVYMSGYPNETIGHHGVLETGVEFLQKPVSAHKLASTLRSALGPLSAHSNPPPKET